MSAKKSRVHTTFDISKICGVYPTTVAKWIDKGLLKAFVTPGGHRRVSHNELLKFLREHNMTVAGEAPWGEEQPSGAVYPQISHESQPLAPLGILVVDDDKNVLSVIGKILAASGKKYKVKCAEDGFSAGQAVIDMSPSLVILDIKLPGIDGFEVCRLIKSRCRKMKILAMSGYATEDIKKSAISAGADAFMAKPFGVTELLSEVENLLSK